MITHFDHVLLYIAMPIVKPEDLKKAYKKEKDLRVKIRMAAVNMVCMHDDTIQTTADRLMQCPNWVSFWVERFREGGIDALRDLPRSGRKPKVALRDIEEAVSGSGSIITPLQLRECVRKKHGVKYHITSARRIMRRLGMSAKSVRRIHVRRAEINEIKRWQRNAGRRILHLKSRGFAVVVFDEFVFIDDPASGAKYWSPKGRPVATTYTVD